MAKTEASSVTISRPVSSSALRQVYLLLSIVVLFWGGNFIAAKVAVPHVPPVTIAAVRFALASLCLLALLRFSGGPRQPVRLCDLPLLVVLGATGYAFNTVMFYAGMRVASASEGSIIVAINPALTVLIAALLLRERVTLTKLGGLVLAFSGVVFVAVDQEGLSIPADHALADLALVGMATSWAFYSVLGKFALRRFSPLAATTYACLAGTVLLIPVSLFERGWEPLAAAPLEAWLAILYMVIFASVISLVVWYHGVQRVGASRTALFNNGVPVAAMLIAAIALHETVTVGRVFGLVLVIAGILLANRDLLRR